MTKIKHRYITSQEVRLEWIQIFFLSIICLREQKVTCFCGMAKDNISIILRIPGDVPFVQYFTSAETDYEQWKRRLRDSQQIRLLRKSRSVRPTETMSEGLGKQQIYLRIGCTIYLFLYRIIFCVTKCYKAEAERNLYLSSTFLLILSK